MHDHGYTLRLGVRPLIRALRIHHVFAEATVLYQTVKLINQINKHDPRLLDIINNRHTLVLVWVILLRKVIFKNTVIHVILT